MIKNCKLFVMKQLFKFCNVPRLQKMINANMCTLPKIGRILFQKLPIQLLTKIKLLLLRWQNSKPLIKNTKAKNKGSA